MFNFGWLDKFSKKSRPERYADVAAFLVAFGICSIVFCAVVYISFFHRHPFGESEDWGAFGAFISGVAGTLLSACTLAALAVTLGLQAQELADSRKLATLQYVTLEKQSATMAQQAFDSAFFNLLERFSQVRDSVQCPYPQYIGATIGPPTEGRKAFSQIYDRLKLAIGRESSPPNRLTQLQHAFVVLYERHESEIGPYFRTLYHIFKFVDQSPQLTEQQKINYANIARAQLSDVELCVLFYDGVTELAAGFKPLIERYGVLKHVNAKHLLHPDDRADESLYLRSAFQSQEQRRVIAEQA